LRHLKVPSPSLPLLILGGATVLVAIGAGLVAAHVTVWALDETVIEQSAVHYTSNLPHSLFHDVDARASSRLYPLLLSIAFHFANGAQAIAADHVLSVVLFVSAAIPVYLMGRVLLRSPWAAVGAGVLSVAVPWLTISSALFEENLAYPLFWWTVLACCHAIWRRRARDDLFALVAIGLLITTRVEFTSMVVGYVVAVAAVCLWRAGGAPTALARVWATVRAIVRQYPFALAVCLVGVPLLLYLRFETNRLEQFLGTYSNVVYRHGALPPNMVEALLVELTALGLGVGLLPAIVAIPWYLRRMSAPSLDRRGVYLLCAGVMLAIFAVLTAFAQGGYLGVGTEERYFFYVIPVFWLGAFAVLEDKGIGTADILVCAVALAALYGAIPFLAPLTQETAFLAPVESVVPHVLSQRLAALGEQSLTIQDLLAVLVLLAGIVTALVWRRWARVRLLWTLGAAAAVQLVIAGYAFAVVDGKVPGIAGRTAGSVSALGWVDAHARVADVTWLENGPAEAPPGGGVPASVTGMRTALFWNSHLLSWASLPQTGLPAPEWPMAALPQVSGLTVNTATGALTGLPAASNLSEVVETKDSPFLQLAGRQLAQSPEHTLAVTALAEPARASWLATGLQPNGDVAAGPPVRLYAFAPPPSSRAPAARAETLNLTIAPPPPAVAGASQAAAIAVQFGGSRILVQLHPGASSRTVSLPLCLSAGNPALRGSLRVTHAQAAGGEEVGGVLQRVSIAAATAAAAASCARLR
jgi:hypothetical protein